MRVHEWAITLPTNAIEASADNVQEDAKPHHRKRRCTREVKKCSVRLAELIEEHDLDAQVVGSDGHYGLFLWPSAVVLAHFIIANHPKFHDKTVLELGCGTALPGIVVAVCGHPKRVFLSDRGDVPDIQRNVDLNIQLNRLQDTTEFVPVPWGSAAYKWLQQQKHIDVILAADCFYQSHDFEKVVATVAMAMVINPHCEFYCTYHVRDLHDTIAPLLLRWRLQAEGIDKTTFMPQDDDTASCESVQLYKITRLQ